MKRAFSRCTAIACLLLAAMALCAMTGCDKMGGLGKKQSYATGKLVDGNGKPVAGVKMVAMQKQPIQGYEQTEAVTSSDGAFKLSGLFPSSAYTIKPWSDKWETDAAVEITAAPEAETSIVKEPVVIKVALSKTNGDRVVDLATGQTRFSRSTDGVITDSQTNLQWLPGPDQNTDYNQAERWIAAQTVAGGGWRQPTQAELKSLYDVSLRYHISSLFGATNYRWVWAGARDSSWAWTFDFDDGNEKRGIRNCANSCGWVFAVRPCR